MAIGKNVELLEKKLGYTFGNESYLVHALTHSSYSNEYKSKGLAISSNERLEFLGDAVLEIVISEYLYDNYQSFGEGRLTRMRQQLVCEKTLARIASKFDVGDFIHLGKGEETDCRTRPKVLADTLEAIVAAIFLDMRERGEINYKRIIKCIFVEEIERVAASGDQDFKTMLQQFVEKDGDAVLEYVVEDTKGPDHKLEFTVVAKVNNNIVGRGTAFSKKDAEMLAAKKSLELFGFKL